MPGLTQDALSAMFFARGLPLEQGKSYEIPVMNKGKLWVTKITVLGDSEAKYDKKWVKAVQLRAENQMVENPEKKNVIDFWYSADADKKLLKFSSKIKLGSVEGETLLYEPGKAE